MLFRVIRVLLLAYFGFGAYLYFAQDNFMYFPTREIKADYLQAEVVNSNNEKLKIWVINPGMQQAVLYFGGNAENVIYAAENLQKALPQHTIYLVNYRGFGGSSGSPSQAALFADALILYDTFSKRHERMSAIGRSLGSGVAVYLGSQRKLQHLVLSTPFDSAESVAKDTYPFYPISLLMRDKYQSIKYAPQVTADVLVLMAANDKLISEKHSMRLAEAFTPEQVQTVSIADSGHNNISARHTYWQAIGEFVKPQYN